MPSRSTKRLRLMADDCRRMARISAAYCLFWLTTASFLWARDTSHDIGSLFLPMSSAIEGREDRFSRTTGER